MKKVGLVLGAVMLFGILPFGASAASDESDFSFEPSTGTITGYSGSGGEVEIPSSIGGVDVKAVGNNAFISISNITSVTIPASVDTIGNMAFFNMSALESVTILGSVEEIGNETFGQCQKLDTITIQGGVDRIGKMAFSVCIALENVTIQDGVGAIGENAFQNCVSLENFPFGTRLTSIGPYAFMASGLTSVSLGANVASIGSGAFSSCNSLTSVTVHSQNTTYSSDDGILFNKSKTTLIQYPAGKTSETYAVPASVATVGSGAFSGNSHFTSITIPQNTTEIQGSAFFGCANLSSISVNGANTAFSDVDGVLFDKDKTVLRRYPIKKAFDPQYLYNTLTSFGEGAFQGHTGITSIELPSGITSIGNNAFNNCVELMTIEFPDGLTSIGNSAFINCKKFVSLEIPDSVTTIGSSTFGSNTSLTDVTIGDGITTIGNSAFNNCTSLTTVKIFNPNFSFVNWGVFNGPNSGDLTIYLPSGSTAFNTAVTIFQNYGFVTIAGLTPPTSTTITPGEGENSDKVTVTIETAETIPANCKIILATYDTSGVLVQCYFKNTTVETGGENTTQYTFEGVNTATGLEYKAFIWDGFQYMKPII